MVLEMSRADEIPQQSLLTRASQGTELEIC